MIKHGTSSKKTQCHDKILVIHNQQLELLSHFGSCSDYKHNGFVFEYSAFLHPHFPP